MTLGIRFQFLPCLLVYDVILLDIYFQFCKNVGSRYDCIIIIHEACGHIYAGHHCYVHTWNCLLLEK